MWSNHKPWWFIAVNAKMVHLWTMLKTDAQMKIRLPEDLKLKIEKSAKEDGRSLNSEIVKRLERSFTPSYTFEVKDNYSYSEVESLFNGMNSRMERLEDIITKLLDKR